MAFHTSPAAHGGFLGVDVFFVISGYLITTLLLREWSRTGGIDLRAFYLRRALRLGPALLFMLLITIPLILTTLRGTMEISPVTAVASVLLYVANWANVVVNAGTGPLTHTWSLSIEEQFYLIWPLVLIAVLARRGRPPATALAALIGVVVLARWICWDLTHGGWIYYATTSHCDGLLLGALLAVVLDRRAQDAPALPGSTAAAWIGLAGLAGLASVLRIDGDATFQYGLVLVAVCSALVVQHLVTSDDGPLIRLLSFRPLAAVGLVSYGLYLYHFPVFQAVQHQHFGRLKQHSLELGITAVLTVFSWFVVEKPALRLKDRLPGSIPGPRARIAELDSIVETITSSDPDPVPEPGPA
jgi:peptidoglycan/LPS O-acetylase OafA/YrhL